MRTEDRPADSTLASLPEIDPLRHFAEVVRGTQDAVLSKSPEGVVTSWNPAAERLFGYSAEEAVGRHVSFIVPDDREDEEEDILQRIAKGERIETFETQRVRKDGVRIDVSLTISPIEDPRHGIVGASSIARDITAERRRRQAQDFLVAATRGLDTSLDPFETARNIVAAAVPDLAELCVVDFVRQDGRLGDSVVAGADPEAARRLEAIRREEPLDPDGEHPVAQVLRAHEPMIWRDLRAAQTVEQVAQSDAHRRLMSEVGYDSAAVVELVARGRTLGALSFLHLSNDMRYDQADLQLLSELADRAAIALDNARLYHERDRIAASLQRGLRPPQPIEVQGLEMSVVFEAAGEGIEIGGDLYDVIASDDGCWIVVADVAGKGIETAGVSVALRHAVRGLTREIDRPGEILRRVNEILLEGTSLKDFATAVLVRMRRHGDCWELELASAGHPPVVHLSKVGTAQLGGGPLLGAVDDPALGLHERVLAVGETLVLCTDGWLEAGTTERHRQPHELAELAATHSDRELAELTGQLREDAIARAGGTLRDDMVVLAVRPAAGA